MLASLRLAVLASLSLSFASTALAADPIEEWWLCVNDCLPDDADCVDSCTDDHNGTSAHVPLVELTLAAPLATCDAASGLPSIAPVYAVQCPDGTTMTSFEMPIYDARGLFVVGYETVWFCIDDGLTPTG